MEHQEKMGYRIRVNIPPVSEDLMAKFHNCDTGNVCDAMDRFGAMHHAIKPLDPGWTMVGRAVTVRTRPCDNLVIYKALDLAQPGDILVINVHGSETGASWGDFTSKIAKAKGLAGIVLDGMARDGKGIRDVGLPVFAKGLTPNGPYKDGPGEVNVSIACGGVPVNPGDIIVGDGDGVVVVPLDIAEQTAVNLEKILEKEINMVVSLEAGELIPAWVNKTLKEKGFDIQQA